MLHVIWLYEPFLGSYVSANRELLLTTSKEFDIYNNSLTLTELTESKFNVIQCLYNSIFACFVIYFDLFILEIFLTHFEYIFFL